MPYMWLGGQPTVLLSQTRQAVFEEQRQWQLSNLSKRSLRGIYASNGAIKNNPRTSFRQL